MFRKASTRPVRGQFPGLVSDEEIIRDLEALERWGEKLESPSARERLDEVIRDVRNALSGGGEAMTQLCVGLADMIFRADELGLEFPSGFHEASIRAIRLAALEDDARKQVREGKQRRRK